MDAGIRATMIAIVLSVTTLWAPRPAWTQSTAASCCSHVSATLTKTMLKVKVARLEIDVDSATAAKVQAAIGGAQSVSARLSDSIAGAYMTATHADATMEFLHSVTAAQFLGGQKDGFKKMVKSGLLTSDAASQIEQDTESQFSFLSEGGIENGDKLIMSLRGDTVSTRFVTAAGAERTSFTRVGNDRRVALLGEYFAPHSGFRTGLIESALESASAVQGD